MKALGKLRRAWIGAGLLAVTAIPVRAGSHLWRIHEIFSNADGTVQFIELKECCGSTIETALGGKPLISRAFNPDHVFTFPSNLVGPTNNKHLLIATPAFAALPGAPTPDFLFSQVPFFAINGDLIEWAPQLNYDEFTFAAGALPTDGVNSIQITNYVTDTFITAANNPTNYAGVTGSVDTNACIDNDSDGYGSPGNVNCASGSALADCNDGNNAIHPAIPENCANQIDDDCDSFVDCNDSQCASPPTCPYGDIDDNGIVDVDDITRVLGAFVDPVFQPVADIEPCGGGDGDIDVDDILNLLAAFMGNPPC